MLDNGRIDSLDPLSISREEFAAVKRFRKTLKPGQPIRAPELVRAAIKRLACMLVACTPCTPCVERESPESLLADVPADATPAEESHSLSSAPTDPSSSIQPQQPEQAFSIELGPTQDIFGDEEAAAQAAWFGNPTPFSPGFPMPIQPEDGLYSANSSSDMGFYFTDFGSFN